MRNLYLFIILIFFLASCDQGLSPDLAKEKVGFGGKVTFSGNWNNEIKQTLIVLFKDPLLSESDFNVFNLKFVSEVIPFGVETFSYSSNDISLISNIEPGTYSYLAVAQSKRDTISLIRKDWEIVALYYSTDDTTQPGKLIIPESEFVNNVDIFCDFNNLPPQPPGGLSNSQIIESIIEYDKQNGRLH